MKTHEKKNVAVWVAAVVLFAAGLAWASIHTDVTGWGPEPAPMAIVEPVAEPAPEPLAEAPLDFKGFACYRQRGVRPEFVIEDYEIEIVVRCHPDVLTSWYIAEEPQ